MYQHFLLTNDYAVINNSMASLVAKPDTVNNYCGKLYVDDNLFNALRV